MANFNQRRFFCFVFSPCLGLVRPLHHLHPGFRLLHELLVFLPPVALEHCLQLLRYSQQLQVDVVGLAVLDLGRVGAHKREASSPLSEKHSTN